MKRAISYWGGQGLAVAAASLVFAAGTVVAQDGGAGGRA